MQTAQYSVFRFQPMIPIITQSAQSLRIKRSLTKAGHTPRQWLVVEHEYDARVLAGSGK